MLHGVRSGIWIYTHICGPVDLFVLSKEDNKSHLERNLSYPNKVFECDFCNAKLENTECLEKHRQSSHRSHIDSIDWQEICAFKKKKKIGCSFNGFKFQKSSVGHTQNPQGLYKAPKNILWIKKKLKLKSVCKCSLYTFYPTSDAL